MTAAALDTARIRPSRSKRARRAVGLTAATMLSLTAGGALAVDAAPDPELRALLLEAAGSTDSFGDRFDAEVWLVDMSARLARQVPDVEERLTILRTLHYEARRARLEPELVLAVIDIESNFDRFAISWAGARGLMQVMPFWLAEIGRPNDNLFDIHTNLRMGCTILRFYLDKERGNLAPALARYNGSRGRRVYSDKVLIRLSKKWFKS